MNRTLLTYLSALRSYRSFDHIKPSTRIFIASSAVRITLNRYALLFRYYNVVSVQKFLFDYPDIFFTDFTEKIWRICIWRIYCSFVFDQKYGFDFRILHWKCVKIAFDHDPNPDKIAIIVTPKIPTLEITGSIHPVTCKGKGVPNRQNSHSQPESPTKETAPRYLKRLELILHTK